MKIQQQLIKFYSFIYDYDIKSLRGGWKDLQLWEIGSPFRTETGTAGHYAYSRSAQHVNDGTLRLLAIIAALHSDNGFILFDEIENGFNPIIIKKVIELMLEADKQVIVTTHSPEVLQYIPDEQAKESVKFLYRAEDGSTAIENFFMLEEAQQKLEMLSPGEVFLDIELERLAEELRQKAKPSPKAER